MLNIMRKHAGSWIIKMLLGAIVIAFIPFGYSAYRERNNETVAEVNDQNITADEYRRSYNILLDQMRQRYGESLDAEMIQTLQLKTQALNQLIDRKLMLTKAAQLGLKVSDAELAGAIRSFEAFQTDGRFDPKRYQFLLNQNRLDEETFESQQRDALLLNKLQLLITENVKVSTKEAKEWYQWNQASVDIDYVLFEPSTYQGIETPDEEIKSFFNERQSDYRTAPKVKVRYLKVNPDDYNNDVTLAEDEIRTYYDANLETYQTPHTVEARHILIKVADDASESEVNKAEARAQEILKKARAGDDFAELARKYSEGPSKDRGGYLGAFEKDAMVKPFADQAFAMQPGQISEPVRTRFGWHIIKVEKINPADTTTFAEAQTQIRKQLTAEKAKSIAYDTAESIYNTSFEGDDLIRAGAEHGLELKTTGLISRSEGPQGIEDAGRFSEAAFELAPMEISDILELADGFYILQVMEAVPPEIPAFENVRARVEKDFVKHKQEAQAKAEAEAFIQKLKEGQPLIQACEAFNCSFTSTGPFKRNAPIPQIGYERSLIEQAFKLSEKRPYPDEPVKGQKGYYVIYFKSRQSPPDSGFDDQKEDITRRLLQQKQFMTMEAWLADLRSNSQIVIDPQFEAQMN